MVGDLDEGVRLRAEPVTSWGAIFAGAAVALGTSIILFALGSGLGFAAISPWPQQSISAVTFTIAGAIWLIVTQWLSASLGGYIAGRLRHRWLATHAHEVFFRDTAHGLVTWALATAAIAAVVAGSLSSLARREGDSLVAAPERAAVQFPVDRLFRVTPSAVTSTTSQNPGDARAEALHIAVAAMASGAVTDEDRQYLVAAVAAQTGVPPNAAEKRVDSFIGGLNEAQAKAKVAADRARQLAADAAIYTALAMLIGAFCASAAAAIGGRLRDEHH